MKLVWDEEAWADYLWWQTQDQRVLGRINRLINVIERSGNQGSGKPEALGFGLHGYWSRRLTLEHRLLVRIGAPRYAEPTAQRR